MTISLESKEDLYDLIQKLSVMTGVKFDCYRSDFLEKRIEFRMRMLEMSTPKDYLDYGIYVCERTAEGWSEPKYVGPGMFVTSSQDGKVYVTEKKFKEKKEISAHIRQAIIENGIFVKFNALGGGLADLQDHFPRTAHPSISPDGRTILFDVKKGYGLFAAYLDESGVWSKPINLCEHGIPANAAIANYSPDGKYIFFHNEGDIYWISSEFVERLRLVHQ